MLQPLRHGICRTLQSTSAREKIIIALGSNVGNRAKAINNALDQVRIFASVKQTSFLYESAPMYIPDQPAFLNAVCEVESDLEPLSLLRAVKKVETDLGRDQSGVRYGPRPIDLDIITYGDRVINNPDGDLVVPHPRLSEREFVLRPLCDISDDLHIPQADGVKQSASELLNNLLKRHGHSGLVKVTPTNTGKLLRWGERTLLMGIINATPDSFSDGGKFNTVDTGLKQAEKFSEYEFDVIDIGGQSTRPGAQAISTDEELRRVLPVTQAIRAEFPSLLISSDTHNAAVAQAMVEHGAEMINDVSAGRLDPQMHSVIHKTKSAAVQMHMRGTPSTMQTLTNYGDGPLAEHIGAELREQLRLAQERGVARWSLIADCGIGFAKDAAQSAALLRSGRAFQAAAGGFPVLLGASRKSFLGAARVREKDWATAGAVAAAVALGGVDMVRVHEAAVGDAVRAGDLVRGG